MAPGTEDQDLGLVSPRNHESFNDRTYRRDSDYHDAESPVTPYDPPDTYNAGDIAMQKTDDPPDSATIISPMQGGKNGEYGFLNYNDTYDSSDTRSLLSTAKHYDHHESRKFLIKTGSYRLFMTILFSASMALCLKAYEGFSKPFIMSKVQVRVFNALMLALSLGLGLNLASSLKRYATILRWTLLTRRYVSLEVFDLILGLETLTKVGKLMFISLPGIRKVKMFRKLPWFRDARDDGTNLTWIACCLWLLINIGVQILVAALSLFWPIDPSDAIPLLTYGNVTVADMVDWKAHVPGRKWDSNYTSMEAAWKYGMEAMQYPEFAIDDIKTDLSSLAGTPVYKGDGFYEYKFFNRNPVHQYTNYLLSTRTVQTRATCDQIETRGKRQKDVDGMYIEGRMGNDWYKYPLAAYAEGSLTWMGSNSEMCGPRCTNLTVYQDPDEGEIVNPGLFLCQSKVDPVQGGDKDFQNLSPEDRDHIYGTDGFARIAAGSIAWTGMNWDGWTDLQFRSYLRGSKWSPYRQMANKDVEDLLMRFTVGAIAAFDDHGVRYNVTKQHSQPIQGQQLQVEWPYIGGILGAIILIQFAALLCLIAFANKSIIRDDSSFSLAMLLSPVVNRIGPAGMNLSGEEIKRHPKLQWKRIRYDYREGKMGEPNKVDIFFQGKDNAESRRSWAPGVYA